MIGPVAHVRLPVGHFALQHAGHKLAEGHMRAVVIFAVAHDEIHRHIKRPFHIVLEAEVIFEGEGQHARAAIVGVAPDIAAPGEQTVRLAFGEGRRGKERGCQRLQLHGNTHLLAHVSFGGEIEINLNGAGAVHHVETLGPDLRHIARHDRVTRFRHMRCFVIAPQRAAADAKETNSHRLGHFAHGRQMLVGFLAGLMQVFERRA
ncbi:hypothetical protein D3C86_1370640 [compost metagenome]